MIITSNDEQNQAIEMLLKSDEHTKLEVARELIRQVIVLDGDHASYWTSVKEGLKDIDRKLVFVLGCMNMGRLIHNLPSRTEGIGSKDE